MQFISCFFVSTDNQTNHTIVDLWGFDALNLKGLESGPLAVRECVVCFPYTTVLLTASGRSGHLAINVLVDLGSKPGP